MIRINLIAGERRVARKAARSFDLGQKMTLIGGTLVVATGLVVGWRYWVIGEREAQVAAELENVRREEQRLAEILQQVTQFEQQSAQLKQRRDLIAELRRGQSAPVHMIDQISRALPDMTWLTSLTQEGYVVTLEGRATSLAALSDFVGNLEATRYFRRPVEIVESGVVTGQNAGPDLIEFTIRGTFQMSGIESTPAAAAAPRGQAPPRPPARGGAGG
jgi:type IV pilus assembly protein PilN